ncbi:MAG TPA: hypothetical protein P5050_07815 [Bacteroidia bacterium]|nr:hypothetical protein [Bacteroidia bacterium]HRS59110.1 hypothetical protein [Bacteroidia bacterium]HRU69123.1 hypothetical protein [Bacteroidia bacterium]
MKKSSFPWITTVLFIVVLATTIFLFFFLSDPEKRNKLFFFNLIYICFLEFIFFGYFAFTQILALSNFKIRPASYPVWGFLMITYIILSVIIVLVYNLAIDHLISKKFYVAVLLVLSVITFISAGFVLKLDRIQGESEDKLKENRFSLSIPLEEFVLLEKRFIRIAGDKNLNIKTESNNRSVIEKLINRLGSIPPNMMERNPLFINKMNQWLGDLETIINQIETDENPENELNKLKNFITDCCDYTDSQKNLFRK